MPQHPQYKVVVIPAAKMCVLRVHLSPLRGGKGREDGGKFLTDMDTQTLSHHPPSLHAGLSHTSISTHGGRGDTCDTHRDPTPAFGSVRGPQHCTPRVRGGGFYDTPNFSGDLLFVHWLPSWVRGPRGAVPWDTHCCGVLGSIPSCGAWVGGTRGGCGVQGYLGGGRSHSAPEGLTAVPWGFTGAWD